MSAEHRRVLKPTYWVRRLSEHDRDQIVGPWRLIPVKSVWTGWPEFPGFQWVRPMRRWRDNGEFDAMPWGEKPIELHKGPTIEPPAEVSQ